MGSLMRTTSFSESENSFFKRYSKPLFNFADFTLQYNNAIDAQRNQTERLDYYDSVISPKYVSDLAFEKQLASVYTDRMFRVVQELISEADKSCRMISIHLFFVLRNKDVNNIPEKYVGNRWLKSELLKAVHGLTSDESSNEDDKLQIGNKCHGRYFGLYQRAFKNKNHLIALDNLLAEITARASDVVSTKGGASDKKSRIKSSIEKAIEKASKLHRRCGKCHKVTDHNARSCGRK
ncbi:uncharacterized protein LOC121774198 [Salvia splendens]|uniref:uncharacterized protein LOC121774198 n=1 Tax=Salvia splendens TaxID=180675 RepID=UPI001C274BCB|nr:uncharacterized protein LOC121774198 [Salvia splendens]